MNDDYIDPKIVGTMAKKIQDDIDNRKMEIMGLPIFQQRMVLDAMSENAKSITRNIPKISKQELMTDVSERIKWDEIY